MRIIAETVASLPLPVYRKKGRGKEQDATHALYSVLHDQTNDEMTSFQFRETIMGHVLIHGNAYAYIERNGAGNVAALWPLLPDRTHPRRNPATRRLEYVATLADGTQTVFDRDEILHIPGLSYNGLSGYSPIGLMRESIGLSMTLGEHAGTFFKNGARPGSVLKHPGKLTDAAYKRLKESVKSEHGGAGNAHKLKILEEGMEFQLLSIPNDQAQFLESRKFQREDICMMFRVPPHMVGILDRATFSNIEQQSIDFVVNTIRPWLVRMEKAMMMRLLTPSERKRFVIEFTVDALLRGDIKSRYEAYAIGKNNGFLTTNMILELENKNAVEGGDELFVPVNMIPARLAADFWLKKGGGGSGKQTGNPDSGV